MEELSNFQYIWEQWIVPLIDDLYSQMDDGFKRYCHASIRDLNKIRIDAEKYYQKKRALAKKEFYGEYHKGDSETDHRMDFHKIGAIICKTLIEHKVYDFDTDCCEKYVKQKNDPCDTDWVVRNALINFRLAFYGSVVFLFQAMRFEYSKNNPSLYKKLSQKGKLDLYKINLNAEKSDAICLRPVKESFENCIVLDLAKRDIGNRSFDYFMYAIILYQLEEHNKNLLLGKNGVFHE